MWLHCDTLTPCDSIHRRHLTSALCTELTPLILHVSFCLYQSTSIRFDRDTGQWQRPRRWRLLFVVGTEEDEHTATC